MSHTEKEARNNYVLYIEYADDPPRVAVFSTFDEAEGYLDALEVSVFDPPQNDGMDWTVLRARIFECRGNDWGTEIDVGAARWEARVKAFALIDAEASVAHGGLEND